MDTSITKIGRKKKMVNSLKDFNDLMQHGFIWIFTGVSAFLAYSTWQMSGSVRELTVEVRHLTVQNSEYDQRFSEVNSGILALRESQLELSSRLYEYSNFTSIIRMNEKEIAVLKEKIIELNK